MGRRTLTVEDEDKIYADAKAGGGAKTGAELAALWEVNAATISRAIARARDRATPAGGDDSPPLSGGGNKGDGMEGMERTDAGASAIVDADDSGAPGAPDVKGTGDAGVVPLAWNLIDRSPLNPRKHFEHDDLMELAANIFEVGGVKQNIIVRPRPDHIGRFWLIAGERRWRAVGLLVEDGTVSEDFAIPARIEADCDDRKHLKLAMIENLQRQNMNPMEEAEGYARLMDDGMSAGDIAREILGHPEKQRFVQLRVNLVNDLCEDAQDALREGKLSVEQGRALKLATKDQQPGHLREILKGAYNYKTTDGIRSQIRRGLTKVDSFPQFKLSYQGDIIIDDDGTRYYGDTAELSRLRREEVEAVVTRLMAEGCARVEVCGWGAAKTYNSWEWTHKPGHELACVIVEVPHDRGQIALRRDMVSNAQLAKVKAGGTVKVDAKTGKAVVSVETEPCTKAHFAYAKRRKTLAMQTAVANDPLIARRLVCLALMGGTDCVDITAAGRRQSAENHGNAASVEARIQAFGRANDIRNGKGFKIGGDGKVSPGDYSATADDQVTLWKALGFLNAEEVDELFASLVALRVGTFNNWDPVMGDEPVAIAIATSLGLVGAEEKHGLGIEEADLEGLRKPGLMAVVKLSGTGAQVNDGKGLDAMTAKGLQGGLAKVAPKIKDKFVLPTLRFALKGRIGAVLASAAHLKQVDLEQAIAPAAKVPTCSTGHAPMPPSLAELKQAMAAHSIFAAQAEMDTALTELVGCEDYPALAATLSRTFGIEPPLLVAEMESVDALFDLIGLLDVRRLAAGISTEGCAAGKAA